MCAAAATLGAVGLRAQQTAPPPRILVVPFENVAREGRSFWLTEAAAVPGRGSLPELFAIFGRIARRIAPPSARTSEELARRYPPVDVFEDYIKGLLAETPATAINYLNTALARQASFDPARLALWDVYADQGDHQRALAAVDRVAADSTVAREARFRAG